MLSMPSFVCTLLAVKWKRLFRRRVPSTDEKQLSWGFKRSAIYESLRGVPSDSVYVSKGRLQSSLKWFCVEWTLRNSTSQVIRYAIIGWPLFAKPDLVHAIAALVWKQLSWKRKEFRNTSQRLVPENIDKDIFVKRGVFRFGFSDITAKQNRPTLSCSVSPF